MTDAQAVPRTEAGKRLLEVWMAGRTHPPSTARLRDFTVLVLAIEAEAASLVTAPPDLDVDTLAKAMWDAPIWDPDDGVLIGEMADVASKIAAEYARLRRE